MNTGVSILPHYSRIDSDMAGPRENLLIGLLFIQEYRQIFDRNTSQ